MTNGLTPEELSRVIAGIETSSAAITTAIESDMELTANRMQIIKNLRFLHLALMNPEVSNAVDVEAINDLREQASIAMRGPQVTSPTVNPVLNLMDELGL